MGLDFIKVSFIHNPFIHLTYPCQLVDSYKLIMDSNSMYSNGSLAPGARHSSAMDPGTVERMLQAATFGAQMLESAATKKSMSSPPLTTDSSRPSSTVKPQDQDPLSSSSKLPPTNANSNGGNASSSSGSGAALTSVTGTGNKKQVGLPRLDFMAGHAF